MLKQALKHPRFTTHRPPISLCRSDPGNTGTIYFCSTMTFSNFNDLNCEKNILHIPHFYHILSILDKLLSCELHYNVGCLTPPHITSHENCCHPLLCNSPLFLFQKLFNKNDFNSKTNALEIFHSSSKQRRSLCRC